MNNKTRKSITIICLLILVVLDIILYRLSKIHTRSYRMLVLMIWPLFVFVSYVAIKQYVNDVFKRILLALLVFFAFLAKIMIHGKSSHELFFQQYYVAQGWVYQKGDEGSYRSSSVHEYGIYFTCNNYKGSIKAFTPEILKVDSLLVKYPCSKDSTDVCFKYSLRSSSKEWALFQHPVLFVNNEEFGNDYYYYAKLRPDLALKNFGLNKLTIGKGNLLYYKNVNDSIDNQVHQCADSIQSQLNRDMLDTMEAFYFHGEIIPMEQVFEEIPQAREYYDRYCGKLE